MFQIKLPRKNPKDLYTKKELRKMFSHLPDEVVEFVYDSFYLGAMITLSRAGNPEFLEIIENYTEFMDRLSDIQQRGKVSEEDLRDTLIRRELQAILNQKLEPNA